MRCACDDREAHFNPNKLLLSHTILLDRLPHPFGKRRKTSSSLNWTSARFALKRHTSKSSSQAIELIKRTRELETVGVNVSPKSIPLRCLNPRATSLDFAFTTQPSSSTFQRNSSHFASIASPIGCYAGVKEWACCSNPLSSPTTLDPRQISACSDAVKPPMVNKKGNLSQII